VSAQSRYVAQVVEGLAAVIGQITEAESQQRGYLLTGDTRYLSTYDRALVNVREAFDTLLKLTRDDARLHPHILDVQMLARARLKLIGLGIHYYRSGDEKRMREVIEQGQPLAVAIRGRFAQLQPEYERSLKELRTQLPALRSDTTRSFAITSTITAVVLTFMAIMVIVEARFIRALSERLLHESRHDVLTGLPNRAYVNEWVSHGIAASRRAGEKLAVLYMDLNGFKQVNDTYGHQAGDAVLERVARELEKIGRDSDFIARLGGDEFAVIMPRVAHKHEVETAARRFSALAVTHETLKVGASVGCAIYRDDGETAEALMKVGDAAMYRRKERSKR